MKNLLSENMLRFGTKNLSEVAKRELVLKSIMETINEHGLHNAVRRRLTEADAPQSPQASVRITGAEFPGNYNYKVVKNAEGEDTDSVYVIQSGTSLGEASKILGTMMKIVGQGNAESQEMVNAVKQITTNSYPAILWKVQQGSTFKSSAGSNYSTVGLWLANSMDSSIAATKGGPFVAARDAIVGTKYGDMVEKILYKFNISENIPSQTSMKTTWGQGTTD
jgi:hypothetical protein